MSVFDCITENIFLFGGFWIFVVTLGIATAKLFRRSGLIFWVKITSIIGGSFALYYVSFWLVGMIFDQRYQDAKINSLAAVFDALSMPTLDTLIFHFFVSIALYTVPLGVVLFRTRSDKKVNQ